MSTENLENQETIENKESRINIDQAIELIVTSSHSISKCWNDFLLEEYGNSYAENRDDLIDIITIVDYIVSKLKDEETVDFEGFFTAIEQVIETGDEASRELVTVGVLEGLQNNCGLENIEYHTCFDQWLKPKSKKLWDGLIYLWESNDSIEEKQEKLKDFKL